MRHGAIVRHGPLKWGAEDFRADPKTLAHSYEIACREESRGDARPGFEERETARIWDRLPARSLRDLLGEKALPKYKVGARTLVKLAELTKYIEKGKVEAL